MHQAGPLHEADGGRVWQRALGVANMCFNRGAWQLSRAALFRGARQRRGGDKKAFLPTLSCVFDGSSVCFRLARGFWLGLRRTAGSSSCQGQVNPRTTKLLPQQPIRWQSLKSPALKLRDRSDSARPPTLVSWSRVALKSPCQRLENKRFHHFHAPPNWYVS